MKIASLDVELVRADSAVAEFLVRVTVDGPGEYIVKGQAIGPRCQGVTTVEIAYPLAAIKTTGPSVTLKGVIPEPNLWTEEMPFRYEATVELWEGGQQTDRRECAIRFRGK